MKFLSDDDALKLQQTSRQGYSIIQIKLEYALRQKYGESIRISFGESSLADIDLTCLLIKDEERIQIEVLIDGSEFSVNCQDSRVESEVKALISRCLDSSTSRPPIKEVVVGARYLHVKTGHTHVVQFISRRSGTLEELVNFRSDFDGNYWSQPKDEFMDGRFQLVK